MQAVGHPVVCDKLYGKRAELRLFAAHRRQRGALAVGRERFGHAGDHAAACAQFEALAAKAGGDKKLPQESLEAWARSLYMLKKYPDAAAKYETLYNHRGKAPAHAYECAASYERAGALTPAAEWYARALEGKEKLPKEYADAVATNLASARLKSGTGDMGRDYWLDRLRTEETPAAFGAGIAALGQLADAGKLDGAARARLREAMKALPPSQTRYYSVGAALLQALSASDKKGDAQEMDTLARTLAAQLAENEKALNKQEHGATVAAAMIYYYRGEAERRSGNCADALASYETVLAAYPYNEWPDAAAYGAAECYLALGDAETARAKLQEIVSAREQSPASQRWREKATNRLAELK
jgi:tetratricopeptide (TPR) repeat protein